MGFAIPRSAPALGAMLAFVLATHGALASEATADSGAAQRAVWTPRKLHFVYQGFTTHYSCEGLRDKVRRALLDLGARKDLQVREGACWRPAEGPEPFPNVHVTMNVLEPADATKTDEQAKVVSARWKAIDLKLDQDPLRQAEDCELLEQIKHSFLPLFATRKVDYQSSCVAHQVSPGGTWLRAEVLVPDAAGAQSAAR